MRVPDKEPWFLALFVLVVGLVLALLIWSSASACYSHGGTPVRGLLWVECVGGAP